MKRRPQNLFTFIKYGKKIFFWQDPIWWCHACYYVASENLNAIEEALEATSHELPCPRKNTIIVHLTRRVESGLFKWGRQVSQSNIVSWTCNKLSLKFWTKLICHRTVCSTMFYSYNLKLVTLFMLIWKQQI